MTSPRIVAFLFAFVLLSIQAPVVKTQDAPIAHQQQHYTLFDDVSWAISSTKVASSSVQRLYDEHMKGCNAVNPGCQSGENFRLKMNINQPAGVFNYTTKGYQKIRAPAELMELLGNFWEQNKEKASIEWKAVNSYHNMWSDPPYFASLEDETLGGGKWMQRNVWKIVRPILEEWTGMALSPVSMYGVREYRNNSILAPHVDRFPLVTSCIINIAQDVDEDWPLEVFDHNGDAQNVTMVPGDIVLYESHSIIHGRPFPMKGRSFVNTFLHFQPLGPLGHAEKWGPIGDNNDLPPYVVPGGPWEEEFYKAGTAPWSIPSDVPVAIVRGDFRALEYVAATNPEALLEVDYNGWQPIHEAAFAGDIESVQFLLENGASVYDRIQKENSQPAQNVLELALASPDVNGRDDPLIQLLMGEMEGSEL